MEEKKYCRDSFVVMTHLVIPPDTNIHGTLYGGKLMDFIDNVGSISAMRHARKPVVTASTDSVDFRHPVYVGNAIFLESFVTYAGRTSMEVFVRAIAEDLMTGERNVCALSFLTMVAIDENGKPTEVPKVIPQTEAEKELYNTAMERAESRKKRRKGTEVLVQKFGTN